tara:strand:+ start:639 stop:812 length:174 start_codon:yes stop_codon:yes gene_type:complete
MKAGDKVHIVWVDGDELFGIFLRRERGYLVIKAGEGTHACLPAHLKTIEVVDENESR